MHHNVIMIAIGFVAGVLATIAVYVLYTAVGDDPSSRKYGDKD